MVCLTLDRENLPPPPATRLAPCVVFTLSEMIINNPSNITVLILTTPYDFTQRE